MLQISQGSLPDPPPASSHIPSNSNPIRVHCSYNYAQQVRPIMIEKICLYVLFAGIKVNCIFHSQGHFPSDPMQPDPIYFLTPRKCSVFGIHCEAIPRQVNFLTDTSGEVGKGANAVVSRLHYLFEVYGLGKLMSFSTQTTVQDKIRTT